MSLPVGLPSCQVRPTNSNASGWNQLFCAKIAEPKRTTEREKRDIDSTYTKVDFLSCHLNGLAFAYLVLIYSVSSSSTTPLLFTASLIYGPLSHLQRVSPLRESLLYG